MQLRPIVATGAKADRAAGGLGVWVFQFGIDYAAGKAVVFGGHIAVVHIDLFHQRGIDLKSLGAARGQIHAGWAFKFFHRVKATVAGTGIHDVVVGKTIHHKSIVVKRLTMKRNGIGADFARLGRRIAAVGKLYRRIAAQQIDDVAIARGLALDVLFIQMLHIAAYFGFNHDGFEFGGVAAYTVGITQNRHETQARQGSGQ